MGVWLTFGASVVIDLLVLLGIDIGRGRSQFFNTPNLRYLFWDLVATGVAGTVLIGLPTLVHLLLRPRDVQRTLELHDPVQRWTDGRSILRGTVAANLAALAAVIGWTCLAWYGTRWANRLSFSAGASTVAAVLLLVAAVATLGGRRFEYWAAFGFSTAAFAVLAYVGVAGYWHDRNLYSDVANMVSIFIVINAITTMLLLRTRHDADATARTQ